MGLAIGDFWAGSQATFGAAVRGRIKAADREYEVALFAAWQGERFAREEKLKAFRDYARDLKRRERQPKAEMLNRFRELAAAGVPMTITKLK